MTWSNRYAIASQPLLEGARLQAVLEGLLTVNEHHRNVVPVAFEEGGICLDVHLDELERNALADGLEDRLGLVAQGTIPFRVDLDLHLGNIRWMRGLHGDFNTMPLSHLVHYLAETRATGLLNLERAGVRKQAELSEGFVRNASSNDPREYLGQFLINLGHITEEQFNKAYETQRETKIFLGKILVMTGSVKEAVVQTALSLKFRETLLEAFQWTDGSFSFEAGHKGPPLDGLDFTIDLSEIDREAEFRQTAWQAIRGAFPSGGVRLIAVTRNLPETPRPGSLDARLLELIHEGYTIDELALALHATDFFLYQRLYALYRLEAIQVDESAVGDELKIEVNLEGDEQTAQELIDQVKVYLGSQHWGDAEELARRAHTFSPSLESADLLKKAEVGLVTELRAALLERRTTPRLAVAPSKVKTMKLSAPERYLLSRFDGKRDLKSIVQASPIRELDALRYVKQFVDAGLVELKA